LTHPLCIAGFRHDLRLTRQLNAFELRHFLLLLDFGGSLRDRTFVPAKKREELRLTLGFGTSELAREKLDKRLRRYHDLELLRLYDDGSLLLTYLLDQDAEEYQDAKEYSDPQDSHHPANSSYSSSNGSANSSNNSGNGSNGSGGERRPSPERRQPNRVYSENPDTVAKRRKYWEDRAADDGAAVSEVFSKNLQEFASKPPAISGEFTADGTQNLRPEISENLPQEAEVFPAGVGSNSNLESGEREFINSSSSGFEFEAEKNLHAKTSMPKPPAPTKPPAALSLPRPKPPELAAEEPPELAAEIVKVKRAEAVKAVLALTNDPPVNRHLWLKYWDICHLSGNLPAWDEAQDRLRKAVMARNEEIGVRAAWLTTALRRLLEESDRQVFIPTKVQIAESSSEDIRALLAQSFPPPGEAAPAPVVAAPAPDVYQRSKGRITPLSEAYQHESEFPEHAQEETE